MTNPSSKMSPSELAFWQAEHLKAQTRRQFIWNVSSGIGSLALASVLGTSCSDKDSIANDALKFTSANPLLAKAAQYAPKAKRVIYLHMAGAPSQLELFDYKPELAKLNGQDCPASLLEGKRFAFLRGVPKMLGPQVTNFKQYGQSGAWLSEHLPHFKEVVDEVTFLKAMHTDEFNHAPAQLLVHTGTGRFGRPSMGSWVTYGLGSENENLPGFMVLCSGGKTPDAGKSVWGSGFLPTVYQGVQCRSAGEPVLYIQDPNGHDRELKGDIIESINELNREELGQYQDPEILTRIQQYEMAYKMQVSVPEAMDIKGEPEYIHEMYGTEPGKSAFSNNCLLARRLVEMGVRFVQLFHWGWDSHGAVKDEALNAGFADQCKTVDKAMTALIKDLKQRGLLDETLVVWGGEFGRTPMRENRVNSPAELVGRDHNLGAFTVWMAGGGIKPGLSYGETDPIGMEGIKNRVHVHDLQATILHTLGLNHEKLTYHFQGRDFRLTDVHGKVVKDILA